LDGAIEPTITATAALLALRGVALLLLAERDGILGAALEDICLGLCNLHDKELEPFEVRHGTVDEVATEGREHRFVRCKKKLDRTLANVKGRKVGDEIVTAQHAHKDEVVHRALEVEPRRCALAELVEEVLAEQRNVQKLPLHFIRLSRYDLDVVRVARRTVEPKIDLFAQEAEVRLFQNAQG
jgi:hypothetical protein